MIDDPERSDNAGVLAPLKVPGYPRLFAGNAISWQIGWMEMTVTGWLALEITGSPWRVAIVDFYRFSPWLIVGFVSGPVIGRFGRRNVILLSQVIYFTIYSTVAFLLWTHRLEYWHLAAAAGGVGGTFAMDFSARRSLLTDLVGRRHTLDAVLLETLVQSLAFMIGPIAGGSLVEWLGAKGCYVVVAAGPLISLLVFSGLPEAPSFSKTDGPKPSAFRTALLGLRYVRLNRSILGVLLITVVMNVLVFPYMTLLPVFARDILGQGPMGLGMLGAASGLGSFLGLVAVNRLRNSLNNNWLFAVGSIVQAGALVAFATSSGFSLSLGLLVFTGVGQGCFVALQSSIVLLEANDEMRDRAMGALILAIGTGPLGRLMVGALASSLGAAAALQIACSLCVLSIITIAVGLPEFRNRRTSRPHTTQRTS